MKALTISVRRIGNSFGVVIPKPVLAQVGLGDEAELTIEHDAIVLRRPRNPVRDGWSEAARAIAERGDDVLLMGEFANADDLDLRW